MRKVKYIARKRQHRGLSSVSLLPLPMAPPRPSLQHYRDLKDSTGSIASLQTRRALFAAEKELYYEMIKDNADKAFKADNEHAVSVAAASQNRRIIKDGNYFLERLEIEKSRLKSLVWETQQFIKENNASENENAKELLRFAQRAIDKTHSLISDKMPAFAKLCSRTTIIGKIPGEIRVKRGELPTKWDRLKKEIQDLDDEFDFIDDIRGSIDRPSMLELFQKQYANFKQLPDLETANNQGKFMKTTSKLNRTAFNGFPQLENVIQRTIKRSFDRVDTGNSKQLQRRRRLSIASENRNMHPLIDKSIVFHFKADADSERDRRGHNFNSDVDSLGLANVDVPLIIAKRKGISKAEVCKCFSQNDAEDFTLNMQKCCRTHKVTTKKRKHDAAKQIYRRNHFDIESMIKTASLQHDDSDYPSCSCHIETQKQLNQTSAITVGKNDRPQHKRIGGGELAKPIQATLITDSQHEVKIDYTSNVSHVESNSNSFIKPNVVSFPQRDRKVHVFNDSLWREQRESKTKLHTVEPTQDEQYYLQILQKERNRLVLAVEDIELYLHHPRKFPQIAADVMDFMAKTAAAARQLLTKRMSKFESFCKELIEEAKHRSRQNRRTEELQSHWDLVKTEIANIDDRFAEIEIMKCSCWRRNTFGCEALKKQLPQKFRQTLG